MKPVVPHKQEREMISRSGVAVENAFHSDKFGKHFDNFCEERVKVQI